MAGRAAAASVGEPLPAERDLLSSCLKAFGPVFFFFSLGCCSMFFQHFLFQMKPKEYNPEQKVLITRDPSPALAAERYLRWPGLAAPATAPLPTSVLEPLTQSTFPVMMVLSDGETGVFQKPKGEDPGAVSEEREGPFPVQRLSWAAGSRRQGGWALRLLPSPSPEVTQALAPVGRQGRGTRPVQVVPGRSESQPQLCYNEVHSANR